MKYEGIDLSGFMEPPEAEEAERLAERLAELGTPGTLDLSGAHLVGTCDPPCGRYGLCGGDELLP